MRPVILAMMLTFMFWEPDAHNSNLTYLSSAKRLLRGGQHLFGIQWIQSYLVLHLTELQATPENAVPISNSSGSAVRTRLTGAIAFVPRISDDRLRRRMSRGKVLPLANCEPNWETFRLGRESLTQKTSGSAAFSPRLSCWDGSPLHVLHLPPTPPPPSPKHRRKLTRTMCSGSRSSLMPLPARRRCLFVSLSCISFA